MPAADSGWRVCLYSFCIQYIQASVEGLEPVLFSFHPTLRLKSMSSLNIFTYSQHAITPSSWEKREFQRNQPLHNTRVGIIYLMLELSL